VKIAVTGASGFIGGAVARDLAARGHEVIGFGRRPDGFRDGRYRMWHLTSGPLSNAPRVDAVIHAAALADDWAPLALAAATNVGGTRAVLESFPGVRFVHLSTSSVYDAFTPTVNAVETAPLPKRFLSAYSRTKVEAERVFDGQNVAILRPHAVYGPGDTTLLPRLLESIRDDRLTLPVGGRVSHTLTSIGNLVQAVRLAIEPSAPVGVFNIGDAEPIILGDLVGELLRRKSGSDVEIRAVSYRSAYAASGLAEVAARIARRRPAFTRYAVSQLGRERTLDLTAARDRLGYLPLPTSVEGAEDW
jgi:nucleoside-diphosphate-sugar epimerase